jgi:hypothetical protein
VYLPRGLPLYLGKGQPAQGHRQAALAADYQQLTGSPLVLGS